MRGYMFRNRWFALLFVGMVLAGVARIVGTEEEGGAIDEARRQIAQQKAQADRLTTQTTTSFTQIDDVQREIVADEELIDPALGEDPTPVDEFAAMQNGINAVVPEPQVVIVSQNVGQQTEQ